jgi:hypothetical protein
MKRHGRLRWAAGVRGTRRGDFLHWFECDARWRDALTPRADPFVLALLPRAMNDGFDLRVSGAPVDALLLDRLVEYQRAWQVWRPGQVREIGIHAEETVVRNQPEQPHWRRFPEGWIRCTRYSAIALNPTAAATGNSRPSLWD